MTAGRFAERDLLRADPARHTWEVMSQDHRDTLIAWINAPRWQRSRRTRLQDARFALASYGSHVEAPSFTDNLADLMVALNLVA
jgi:hypothetical protein